MDALPKPGLGVVILGGTAGVGLETATQFAEHGARVILLGRNDERGAAACAAVRERVPDGEVEFIRADTLDPAAATIAEQRCRDRLGAIDVLVTTVGPSAPPRLVHTIPIEDVAPRIQEILLPAIHMIHASLPGMRARRSGSIIAVASDAAKLATPGETLVGAAMAAIVMYCKAAALEAKREGVRINMLTPSLIGNTPGAALIAGEPFSNNMFEKAASLAHLGLVHSEDLAAMTLYLASPAAERMTGQTISINGGISIA